MPEVFHFGVAQRGLLGIRHCSGPDAHAAVLICAPLLQEGIRCQRALWSLSETLMIAGVDVLRFDWFGSGDSAGDSDGIDVPGLVDDLRTAESTLRSCCATSDVRLLGLRSAVLPLLAYASTCREPVDLVLWAPVLDGRELVAGWREQHRRQLDDVGRYLRAGTRSDDDELLGFVLSRRLLDGLEALQADKLVLPAGSRILLAQWQPSPGTDAFVRAQRDAGVLIELLQLESVDAPDWDHPGQFDTQLFPRRAVIQITAQMAEAG